MLHVNVDDKVEMLVASFKFYSSKSSKRAVPGKRGLSLRALRRLSSRLPCQWEAAVICFLYIIAPCVKDYSGFF